MRVSSAQRKSEASNTLPFSSLWTLLGIGHSPRGMEELPLIVGTVASPPWGVEELLSTRASPLGGMDQEARRCLRTRRA